MEARTLHDDATAALAPREAPSVVLGGRGLRRGLGYGLPLSLLLWAVLVAGLRALLF